MARTSKELKRIARDILNNRYTIPMGAFLISGFIPALIETPFSMSSGEYPTNAQTVIYFIAEFIILLIGQVLSIGVAKIHLSMTRASKFQLTNLFDPFRNRTEQYFGAAFLLQMGLLLCMIPGITAVFFCQTDITVTAVAILITGIVISLSLLIAFTLNYQLVFFLLLDHPELKTMDAFKESARIMKGNKKRLLYIQFSFLGWYGLILCSFGIASLWASPYMTQTLINFYLDCTGELNQIPVRNYNNDSNPTPDFFS